MKVIGKWLTQTSTIEGLKFFEMLYEMKPEQVIKDYELERFVIPEHVKAIVLPEYNGDINQTFIIERELGDEVIVLSGGCCDTIFNTDGMAFMDLFRNGEHLSRWVLDNSPYEMNDDDLEECEFDFNKLPEGVTRDQVIFVAQL